MFPVLHNHFGVPSTLVPLEIDNDDHIFYSGSSEDDDYIDNEETSLDGVMVPEINPIDVASIDWTHQEPNDPDSPSNFSMGRLHLVHSPINVQGTGAPFEFFKEETDTEAEPKPASTFDKECPSTPSVEGTMQSPSKTMVPVKQEDNHFQADEFLKVQKANLAVPIIKKEPRRPVQVIPKAIFPKKATKPVQQRRPRQVWTKAEDDRLLDLLRVAIDKGESDQSDLQAHWKDIAGKMNTKRTAKQCRDRWHNYLRPGIKKGQWTKQEEKRIGALHAKLGGKWSVMAQMIPHRSENDIKNKWNSMKRKEQRASSNKARTTIARVGLKKPPPSAIVPARKATQAGKSITKKKVTFAIEKELPAVDENRPFPDGVEEDVSMPDTA